MVAVAVRIVVQKEVEVEWGVGGLIRFRVVIQVEDILAVFGTEGEKGYIARKFDATNVKDADDYIKAFNAWLNEDTPFENYIKIAIKQLESLKRKQQALRAVLDDSKDSPFLTTAAEVDQYILANSKRILNRVMIYDQGDVAKYNEHAAYLETILGEDAHVLSDFENLILEVSQIGDNATAAATPCLTELTNALRSVRSGAEAWEQQEQHFDPPQQMMMQ